MKRVLLHVVFAVFSYLVYGQAQQGFEINITINGLKDSTVFFAYHLGDRQYVRDTLVLDSNGKTAVKGNEALQHGIYMIVLPGHTYFEMLVSDDQHFSASCLYGDYVNTLKFDGSDENTAFLAYQKTWRKMQEDMGAIAKRASENRNNSDSLGVINRARAAQERAMKDYLNSVAAANRQNVLGALVKAILPVEIPVFDVPAGAGNPDSLLRVLNYTYNKNHFFDNISLDDDRLVRTPILQAKLKTFFSDIVIQVPDSINMEIDRFMAKCSGNYRVFQFVSVFLFNHFRESDIMGHDAVVVKLADDIYLSGKADWITQEFKDDLRRQVELIRPNLIGKQAQNMVMDSYSGIFVSLYDIEKDFTILYFWEPDCGHCKEATPKLKTYYEKAKNDNVEIFAVCTTTDREKWSKYIQDNQLLWINGWDPQRQSHFDYYYNIQSTPMVYILDRNKKIIAKKLAVENIESFIENYRKYAMQ
ncbi:MAG: redoxin domain-containing protein [Bacteroidales bacterium]|jgi:thiol-disulfide isomerase/thioredoxin|nr:redoxin domain-containing protein [Bacteroidales bacterium]